MYKEHMSHLVNIDWVEKFNNH